MREGKKMKITIDIKTDSVAFEEYPEEFFGILNTAVNRITGFNARSGKLYDSNGKTVGKFKVTGK